MIGCQCYQRPQGKQLWTRILCYTDLVTRNLTLTVEEDAIRWAKHRAADLDTSVSRLVGELLEREMRTGNASLQALERFRQRSKKGWPIEAGNRLTREQANERER